MRCLLFLCLLPLCWNAPLGAQSPYLLESKEIMPILAEGTRDIAVGDVDRDGFPEILVANDHSASGGLNRLYRNDGRGGFTTAMDPITWLPPGPRYENHGALLVDLNRDQYPEAIIASKGGANYLFMNDGAGNFVHAHSQLPAHTDFTLAIEAGDLDGDTDLDLFIGNWGQCRLYLNDGFGVFTDATSRLPTTTGRTEGVALADFDGDHDLDVVLANMSNMQNVYLRNDGTGHFSDETAQFPTALDETRDVVAEDFDEDGDIDIFFANSWEPDRLYLNDGSGSFTDASSNLPSSSGASHGVAVGDVNEDGHLDLYIAGGGVFTGSRNPLYLGDGNGGFTNVTWRTPAVVTETGSVALADVDGDGDLDAVLGDGEWILLPLRVHVNARRHLAWRNPPSAGATLDLDLWGPPGTPWGLFISNADARIPLGLLGLLRLSPSFLFFAAGGTLDGNGEASVAFFVPSDFAGTTLYEQGLVGLPLQLTNLEKTRF